MKLVELANEEKYFIVVFMLAIHIILESI